MVVDDQRSTTMWRKSPRTHDTGGRKRPACFRRRRGPTKRKTSVYLRWMFPGQTHKPSHWSYPRILWADSCMGIRPSRGSGVPRCLYQGCSTLAHVATNPRTVHSFCGWNHALLFAAGIDSDDDTLVGVSFRSNHDTRRAPPRCAGFSGSLACCGVDDGEDGQERSETLAGQAVPTSLNTPPEAIAAEQFRPPLDNEIDFPPVSEEILAGLTDAQRSNFWPPLTDAEQERYSGGLSADEPDLGEPTISPLASESSEARPSPAPIAHRPTFPLNIIQVAGLNNAGRDRYWATLTDEQKDGYLVGIDTHEPDSVGPPPGGHTHPRGE